MTRLALVCALCATAAADKLPTDAAAPQVDAIAYPTDLVLGGKLTLFVTATYDVGVEVNLREPVELGGAFEVARRKSSDRATADGKRVREWQLELYAWEVGDLQIPPIAVTYTIGGRVDQVASNPVPVHVAGESGAAADDDKALRADAPPVALTSRSWELAVIGAAVVAAIIAGALVFFALRRRRHVVELVAGSGSIPKQLDAPSARALEKLLAIERSGVLARDDDRKRGYVEMAEVVREYLGARYHVKAAELTTAELLRALAEIQTYAIEEWLEKCDRVRYGGFRATEADATAVLADARALVVASAEPAKEAA